MNEKTKEAWNRQWQGHILSTCAHHMRRETAAAISQGWSEFFAGLPDGAVTLDVATGNGILPLTALSVSEQMNKDFEIHGTDMAAIDPAAALPEVADKLSEIEFHPETPSENLPFEDDTFDAVTSQHGLEYGDIEKTVDEIGRVLKPEGHFRFLIHAAEGQLVGDNVCKIEQCRFVLEEAKLFELTERSAIQALKGEGDGGEELRRTLEQTYQKFKNDPLFGDLNQLLSLLWGAYEQRGHFPDAQALQNWIAENRAEMEAQMVRIHALQEAAFSEREAKALADMLSSEGAEPRVDPVKEDGVLIDWLIER